ncbi:hypothetical protein LC613_38255 [Nostoc sphaeroides CHAB 2801]|uniref:hypothetical protein n=1 Tax=Nostoc sphaeroides TaxID=446679 RepID=UPI001E5794EC|nr:hypothetical protein [Nostoc sphaeroides]MCC5633320.1 hypothetical protein [Nostoc sphaeroides CHAB 2801]
MMFAISLSSLGFMHTLNSNISEILDTAEKLYKEIPLEELELQKGSFFDSVPMQLRGEITEKSLKIVALPQPISRIDLHLKCIKVSLVTI